MAVGDNQIPNSNPAPITPASVLGGAAQPVAPTPPETAAVSPAGMPINSTPAAQPKNPPQGFVGGLKAGIAGPKYKTDDQGQITPVNQGDTSGVKPKLGNILGSMLMGALSSAAATKPGMRGGAAFASGVLASQEAREKDDALARQQAQQNFANKQAAQKGQDEHNLALVETARMSAESIKIARDIAHINTMEPGELTAQKTALSTALLDQQKTRDEMGLESVGYFDEPGSGTDNDPMNNPTLARQLMVTHDLIAMPHINNDGTVHGVNLYRKDALDRKTENDVTVSLFQGQKDKNGMPVMTPHTFPAGELTTGQVLKMQAQSAEAQTSDLKTAVELQASRAETAYKQRQTELVNRQLADPDGLTKKEVFELQKGGQTELDKATDAYSKFLGTANSIAGSIALSKNGNELASAIIPLQGTLFITTAEGVKRINDTELRGVANAGSIARRGQNAYEKFLNGDTSAGTKNDLKALVDAYKEAKYLQYLQEADVNASNHRIDDSKQQIFDLDGKKTTLAAAKKQYLQPEVETTRLVDANGQPWDVPTANVDAAMKKHPELKRAQ
jgi:hypothetical protein